MKTKMPTGRVGLITLLLIFSLFATLAMGTVAAAPSVSVDPALTENLCPGDTFPVTVEVNSDTYNLKGVTLDLTYNPAVLQVNSVDVNDELFGADNYIVAKAEDDGAGTVEVDVGRKDTPVPESGTLVDIVFEVKASVAAATYSLTLQNVDLADNSGPIPGVGLTNGAATVKAPTTYYQDADGDGYGNSAVSQDACSAPTGYVSDSTDCDDTDDQIWQLLTGYTDGDNDGYGTGAAQQVCSGASLPSGYAGNADDCNDGDASVNPGADEICGDGIDNNCDGQIDEGCCACDFCLDLDAGWNLVSVPRLVDGPNDAETVFNLSSIELCEYWDGCADPAGWVTDAPADIEVLPGRGYMVSKESAKTLCLNYSGTPYLSGQTLCADNWNMIGFPSLIPMTVAEFRTESTLGDTFPTVWQWDDGGWHTTDNMIPGRGYVLWMTDNAEMPAMIG